MHVGFFDLILTMRLQRQMACLRRAGEHRITLLTDDMEPPGDAWKRLFDRFIDVRLAWLRRPGPILDQFCRGWLKHVDWLRLARATRALDCDVLHVYGGLSNFLARIVLENAPCPVVYDAYDFAGVRKGVEALPEDERQAERFCLEHADAIITKFPEETLDYYRKLGYRLPRKVLHQLDYCDDASWSPIDPDRPSPAEWHLVQGGTIAPASASREEFGYQQYHDIAESLAVQGLHFHLYPSPIQARRWADFECYRQLAARQPRFHFHRPVPFHQFCRELTKYDVGAWIHPRRAPQLTEHYWYGVGNKLTVYAEAGLPLLVNNEVLFGSRLVRENGIGVTFDFADIGRLKGLLDAADWPQLKRNLMRFREEHSIGRQCGRLTSFYEQVIS